MVDKYEYMFQTLVNIDPDAKVLLATIKQEE